MSDDASQPATIMCEQAIAVEYRDGLFYLFDPALGVVRVARPRTLLVSFQNCARAIQDYHTVEGAEPVVLAFPSVAKG